MRSHGAALGLLVVIVLAPGMGQAAKHGGKGPPTVFLSFLPTCQAVASGQTPALKGGIFYFGCTREHLFPSKGGIEGGRLQFREFWGSGRPKGMSADVAFDRVKRAVAAAERQNRVAWRPIGGRNTFDQLNALLSANGFAPIECSGQACYMPANVARAIRAELSLPTVSW